MSSPGQIAEEKAETPDLSRMVILGEYLDHFYSMEKMHTEDVLNKAIKTITEKRKK